MFNASAKAPNGPSLNEVLSIDPLLQPDLLDTLIRFYIYTFVFAANVAKMYRQVLVHEDDRDVQRILWRKNPVYRISTYQLNTVTYGTGPASFSTTKCLAVLASQVESRHLVAAEKIRNC